MVGRRENLYTSERIKNTTLLEINMCNHHFYKEKDDDMQYMREEEWYQQIICAFSFGQQTRYVAACTGQSE